MNRHTRIAMLILALTLISDIICLFAPQPVSAYLTGTATLQDVLSEQLADKVLRLHIIADNDSKEAQAVKLLVRDAVYDYLSPLPDGIDSKEEVCDYLSSRLDELTLISDEVLQQNHCNYRTQVSVERRYFPLKTYGSYTFPPGKYDALCITLGTGQGQNWWCLAFPSLCLLDDTYAITDSAGAQQLKILLTDEEYEAILIQEPQIRFRFRLLEWLKGKRK